MSWWGKRNNRKFALGKWNEYQHQRLWQNWKWLPFHKYVSYGKISSYWLPLPPQSLGLRFSKCQWKWNISIGHYEKIKKWPPFHKNVSCGKISNYHLPPKFGSLVYPTSHLCVVLHFLIFLKFVWHWVAFYIRFFLFGSLNASKIFSNIKHFSWNQL